jgi:hypothetical protein
MASTLVQETGVGTNANANTYETAANIRAYATARGIDLATDDAPGDLLVDIMAVKAMDFLEGMASEWAGWKVYPTTQPLSWPRDGVTQEGAGLTDTVRNGYENLTIGYSYRDSTIIPVELKKAQCALVMQVKAGVDLMPTALSGKFVTRQKIGPIEKSFSEAVGIYTLPKMPVVDNLLFPLLKNGVGILTSYRA